MTNSTTPPIDCHLYDHFELACLHRYELLLTLRDGEQIRGRAETTRIQAQTEYLVLQAKDGATTVALHQIKHVAVLQPDNAAFTELNIP